MTQPRLTFSLVVWAGCLVLGCTGSGAMPGGSGGSGSGSGGAGSGTGGASTSGGTSGATGGSGSGTGGATATGSGGTGTGGSTTATGGSGSGTGGGTGSGGAIAGTGGTTGTGGASGGGGRGSGGASGTGGRAGGASGTGGQAGGAGGGAGNTGTGLPARSAVIAAMTKANDYFMAKWPDPGTPIVTDKERPSHIWTRGVYYEGLMALYAVDAQKRYYDYAVSWGTKHAWGLNNGTTTTSADDQCAGQTYIDLYNIDPQAERLRDIKTNIDRVVSTATNADWSWVDAVQMAMPVYARLGVMNPTGQYFSKMYSIYAYTKNTHGTAGLYNKTEHLWWRDQDFDPPYVEPNGQDCYWSRGNGWAYAALVRVLDLIPTTETHRAEYLGDFTGMSDALRTIQRTDGFWNVSLADPTNFGGKELTGTALFTYGMAWGVRKGLLPDATYRPLIIKAWNAMVTDSLKANGFLGWVQGTGKQPSDGQPLSADKVPNFEDYGLGCFLLAGSEIAKLAL